jgi:hypothetical protein
MDRWLQGVLIAVGSVFASVIVLATALAWGPHHCKIAFPMVIGCAIGSYENLSGGLFAAGAALFAGWLAWSAVQVQVGAEERRAKADRLEIESVLHREIDSFAEALASVWKILEQLDQSPNEHFSSEDVINDRQQKLDAAMWGMSEISSPTWLSTARKMVAALGWERRRKYEDLFTALDGIQKFQHLEKFEIFDALSDVRATGPYFWVLRPDTHAYFDGLFHRGGKAQSLGYSILASAGMTEEDQ